MARKNYALDLYQTKTKGTGSLRGTKWYQALCNRVMKLFEKTNMHSQSEWAMVRTPDCCVNWLIFEGTDHLCRRICFKIKPGFSSSIQGCC